MILMQINGLSKSFGSESILSNVKLEVKDLDRIAIVGRNGAGKIHTTEDYGRRAFI